MWISHDHKQINSSEIQKYCHESLIASLSIRKMDALFKEKFIIYLIQVLTILVLHFRFKPPMLE